MVIGSHPLRITFRKYKHLNLNFFGSNDKIIFRARSADEMIYDASLDSESKSDIYIKGSEYSYVSNGMTDTAFS